MTTECLKCKACCNGTRRDIVHLHSQRLDAYKGNFIQTRPEKLKSQQREYDAQMRYRQHLQVHIMYTVYVKHEAAFHIITFLQFKLIISRAGLCR